MADLNPEVIDALVRFMNGDTDLTKRSDAEVIELMRVGRAGLEIVGKGAAEPRRRDPRRWTWPAIGEVFGVNQSTAFRWAQPYLREGEE